MGRLYWEDHSSTELPLSFDGVPFIVIGHQLQECANGPDRHRAEKNKASEHKVCSSEAECILTGHCYSLSHDFPCFLYKIHKYIFFILNISNVKKTNKLGISIKKKRVLLL